MQAWEKREKRSFLWYLPKFCANFAAVHHPCSAENPEVMKTTIIMSSISLISCYGDITCPATTQTACSHGVLAHIYPLCRKKKQKKKPRTDIAAWKVELNKGGLSKSWHFTHLAAKTVDPSLTFSYSASFCILENITSNWFYQKSSIVGA